MSENNNNELFNAGENVENGIGKTASITICDVGDGSGLHHMVSSSIFLSIILWLAKSSMVILLP